MFKENFNKNFDLVDFKVLLYCIIIKKGFILRKKKALVDDPAKNNFTSIKKPQI